MNSYEMISALYGDEKAVRSKQPYINHINEGIAILKKIGAKDIVQDAFCLHPVFQDDKSFVYSLDLDFTGIPVKAILLAMEYRRVANSYLSDKEVNEFVGLTCDEVKQMLIADKVQNYKDFMLYNRKTHERARELDMYFENWFEILGIDINKFLTDKFEYI